MCHSWIWFTSLSFRDNHHPEFLYSLPYVFLISISQCVFHFKWVKLYCMYLSVICFSCSTLFLRSIHILCSCMYFIHFHCCTPLYEYTKIFLFYCGWTFGLYLVFCYPKLHSYVHSSCLLLSNCSKGPSFWDFPWSVVDWCFCKIY